MTLTEKCMAAILAFPLAVAGGDLLLTDKLQSQIRDNHSTVEESNKERNGFMITNKVPAGNIQVVSVNGHDVELDVELRDTSTDWFYWCFKVKFPEKGLYRFRFTRGGKVGTRGPAVSRDGGKSWKWLDAATHESDREFEYTCNEPGEELIFCQTMQYLQNNWETFLAEFSDHGAMHPGTLCQSRKGRDVELLTIREGNPKTSILLTSRHHAGETMATHALEGFLRAVLADDAFGRSFRQRFAVFAVPFTDKDGVEDGDQGKNRIPHDHARDYQEPGIYPETIALRKLLDREKPAFVLDLHCPWIRGGETNEVSYMVGTGIEHLDREMDRFADLLEAERIPQAPYFKKNVIPFGTSWNTAQNYTQGKTIKHYAAGLPFVRNAQTIEIPFANFGEATVDRNAMLAYGASLARAVYRYLTENNGK